MTKMYVTRYATTDGILEVDATESGRSVGLFWATGLYCGLRIGRDIFVTKGEANADAAIRVKKKIKSLEKQIEKLKAMNFD